MKLRNLVVAILATVMFVTMGKTVAFADFSDIPPNHRAYSEIKFLEDEGIVMGRNGKYHPNDYLKRSEAAVMLGRVLGLDGTQRNTSFKDVKKSSFASGYIESAYQRGIINGTGNGKFSPDSTLTRGQMAIMLANAFQLPEANADYFMDKPRGSAAFDAINKIAEAGISNGVDGIYYRPHDYLTRADFAIFLARGMNGKFRVSTKPINIKTIIIDAGHGGDDPGARANGIIEKEVNLDTALKTEKYLRNLGYKVVLTRSKDIFLTLSERVEIGNKANGDAFVSIHSNAGGGTGTETYYYGTSSVQSPELRKESEELATAIQKRLIEILGMRDRGVKYANFHVLRENTKMPAALVELAFVDNKNDAAKLKSSSWRDKAAKAISLGINDYFEGK